MSDEQSNQPRKVKDLKARLGRTISPQTPGAAMPAGIPTPNLPGLPPGMPGAPAPAAAAGDDAPAAAPAAPGVVPPPVLPPPALPAPGVNPLAAPLPGPKAVVEPPMVKKQREEEEKRRAEEEKRKKRAAADPFAAAAPPAAGTARVVIGEVDEATLNEALAKQKKSMMAAVTGVVVAVAVVFMLIGKSVGGNMAQRAGHNRGVDAAENLSRTVARGDTVLQQMKGHVDKLAEAARPTNAAPHVDYAALEALVAIENPFTAEHFVETNYTVFDANTVDQLLKYYNSTREAFDRVQRLARSYRISNPESRRQLDAAFQASTDFAKYPAGCVPVLVGTAPAQRAMCNMVFLDLEHMAADGVPTRTRPTASATNRPLFAGQSFPDNFDKVVIPVNFETSRDVMGATLHLHDRYMRDLNELKGAVDEAINARAAFRNELTRIAALPRQFTF